MSAITINAALEKFLSYTATYLSPRTVAYYKKDIGYFISYLADELHYDPDQLFLEDLRSTILFEYLIFLRSKVRYDNHPSYGSMNVTGVLKANTVNAYMRAVKVFFNYLYRNHYTGVRYTEGLRLLKNDKDQIMVLTQSEVDRIDQTFDFSVPIGLRNYCIVHLMLDVGLRRTEVINLMAKDILFDSGAIAVNRSKGNKSRVVLLCPRLAAVLHHYFDVFQPNKMLFFTDFSPMITDSVINKVFLSLGKRSGVTRIYPHLLRHTFATSYIMGGGNLEMLRILLGHYDYSITRTYLHLAAQNQILHTDVYRLDPIFFKSVY